MSILAERTRDPGTATPARRPVSRAQVLRRRAGVVVLLTAVVGVCLWRATSGPGALLNRGGVSLLGDVAARAFSPRLDAEFLAVVLRATGTTLAFAIVGAAGALVVGILGGLALSDAAWVGSSGPVTRVVRGGLRILLVAVRSVHELVWALIFVSVLGLNPLVAVLALVVPFGAQTAQVYAETFDGVRSGAYAAARRAGAPHLTALGYTLVPAASPLLLSYGFYRLECSVRSTVLLGFVGVGGLGQELTVSLQSRNWDEVWTLVWALLAVAGAVEAWSARARAAARPRRVSAAGVGDAEGVAAATTRDELRAPARTAWSRWSLRLGLPVVVISWWWTDADLAGLVDPVTWAFAGQLVTDLVPPELPVGGWAALAAAVLDTLAIAVLTMTLAVTITLVLAPWAASGRAGSTTARGRSTSVAMRVGRAAMWAVSRFLLLILRSVPPTVWAVLALFAFFPGVLPGAVALGLYSAGILGRLVAEAWEVVDRSPRDDLVRGGVSPWRAGILAIVPPSLHQLTAYTLYRFEVSVRDTAVVGVVGAAGLGRTLGESLATFNFGVVSTALVAYLAVSAAVELLSRRIRRSWAAS